MKELEPKIQDQLQVAEVAPELRGHFVKSVRLYPGQKLFKMDRKTFEITEVLFEQSAYNLNGGIDHKVTVEHDKYYYTAAINVKVADRKFFKLMGLKYPKNGKPEEVK